MALLVLHHRKKSFYGQTIRFGDGEQAPSRGRQQRMEKSRRPPRGSPNWQSPRRQKHFNEALDRFERLVVPCMMKMNSMKIGVMLHSDHGKCLHDNVRRPFPEQPYLDDLRMNHKIAIVPPEDDIMHKSCPTR